MSWTDERVERLKKLWNDGLSASQIAADLGGVTRNAVIGKVHRLGLSGRAKSPSRPAAPRAKRSGSNFNSRPRTARTTQSGSGQGSVTAFGGRQAPVRHEEIEAPVPLKLELVQLTEMTCKWPIGDPAEDDFHFCGHGVKEGGPYCAYHANLAYQPLADRRRERKAAAG